MSKAGYPYDNAPMERYFNTLKNECTNLYEFRTEKELYHTVEEFAYATYNHVRPHSYNGYRTPYQVTDSSIKGGGSRFLIGLRNSENRKWQIWSMAWPRSGAKHHDKPDSSDSLQATIQ